MRYIIVLCCILFFIGGCVHSYPTALEDASAIERLNRRSKKRVAHIYLHSGERLKGRQLILAPDSTRWNDYDSGELRVMLTDNIAKIRMRSTGQGLMDGLGGGLLAGIAVGVVTASIEGGDHNFDVSSKRFVYGFAFGTSGGLIGFWVGGMIGASQNYKFTREEETIERSKLDSK